MGVYEDKINSSLNKVILVTVGHYNPIFLIRGDGIKSVCTVTTKGKGPTNLTIFEICNVFCINS